MYANEFDNDIFTIDGTILLCKICNIKVSDEKKPIPAAAEKKSISSNIEFNIVYKYYSYIIIVSYRRIW